MHAKCSSYVFSLVQQRTIARKKIYYPQGFKCGNFARFSRLLDYIAQFRGLETFKSYVYMIQQFCESLYTSFASNGAIKWDHGIWKVHRSRFWFLQRNSASEIGANLDKLHLLGVSKASIRFNVRITDIRLKKFEAHRARTHAHYYSSQLGTHTE